MEIPMLEIYTDPQATLYGLLGFPMKLPSDYSWKEIFETGMKILGLDFRVGLFFKLGIHTADIQIPLSDLSMTGGALLVDGPMIPQWFRKMKHAANHCPVSSVMRTDNSLFH